MFFEANNSFSIVNSSAFVLLLSMLLILNPPDIVIPLLPFLEPPAFNLISICIVPFNGVTFVPVSPIEYKAFSAAWNKKSVSA